MLRVVLSRRSRSVSRRQNGVVDLSLLYFTRIDEVSMLQSCSGTVELFHIYCANIIPNVLLPVQAIALQMIERN
jgi:hypothetical protein